MLDPFGRSSIPTDLREQFGVERAKAAEREQRVRWVAEVAYNPTPSAEALLFVRGAMQACLEHGGSLDDHLRLRPPRGSHSTAAALWRRLRDQDPSSSQ